ncbi:hypothetical protein GX411_06460 [Candidatus Fermentibacteria bacterium]|nr:hypothetical protein [Candidatus Fermentibacteria bacterium]
MKHLPDHRDALVRIISAERALHPDMEVRDLHKLLFQSEMGADHLLGLPERVAEEALAGEWNALPLSGCWFEPPLQMINPAAPVARLHLAPLKALGIPLRAVADTVFSQKPRDGSLENLAKLVEEAVELAEEGLIRFHPAELRSIVTGPVPPHHSPSYGSAHYRVLNDAGMLAESAGWSTDSLRPPRQGF